jgi:hypothetical protein
MTPVAHNNTSLNYSPGFNPALCADDCAGRDARMRMHPRGFINKAFFARHIGGLNNHLKRRCKCPSRVLYDPDISVHYQRASVFSRR